MLCFCGLFQSKDKIRSGKIRDMINLFYQTDIFIIAIADNIEIH